MYSERSEQQILFYLHLYHEEEKTQRNTAEEKIKA